MLPFLSDVHIHVVRFPAGVVRPGGPWGRPPHLWRLRVWWSAWRRRI